VCGETALDVQFDDRNPEQRRPSWPFGFTPISLVSPRRISMLSTSTSRPANRRKASYSTLQLRPEGGWCVIDFWESRQDYDAAAPRVQEAIAAAGVTMQGPPDIEEFPVYETLQP
jgi:hypothetical protein